MADLRIFSLSVPVRSTSRRRMIRLSVRCPWLLPPRTEQPNRWSLSVRSPRRLTCWMEDTWLESFFERSQGLTAVAFDILGRHRNRPWLLHSGRPAGDIVELFCVGFGPTDPPVPAGKPFTGAAPVKDPISLYINDVFVRDPFRWTLQRRSLSDQLPRSQRTGRRRPSDPGHCRRCANATGYCYSRCRAA